MKDCMLCGHPRSDHDEAGCHGRQHTLQACECTYLEPQPLKPNASAAEHRARSDWWDHHARISWDMALRARDDLDRWYPLMRFHRMARKAEIDHRRYAEWLTQPPTRHVAPGERPAYVAVPVVPDPPMSMAKRLELASIP